ncbi:MAG: hypothetical protein KJZ75_11320 [Hyphomonadaceae bacterium]|nr:hypothetical protein [Hyphomonadaceae bacterium]
MPSLLSLAQRVSALMEPDRELDAAIHRALFPSDEHQALTVHVGCAGERNAYTRSFDAVVCLHERLLPARAIGVRGGNSVWAPHHEQAGGEVWEGEVIRPEEGNDTDAFDELVGDDESYTWKGTSPARALLAALLVAIQDERVAESALSASVVAAQDDSRGET